MGFACYFFPADSPSATFSWRFPLALQILPPLAVLAGSKFIPFSPRWLLSQDRREEAFEVVKRLHARAEDKEHIAARQEFYLMEKQFELDKTFEVRPFEIFRTKPNLRRAFMGCMLMWGDQFLGIFVSHAVRLARKHVLIDPTGHDKLWYSPRPFNRRPYSWFGVGVLIYASLGLAGFRPLLLNACWTTFTIVGNTWTALYVDRFGRRTFMLIGSCGCVVSLIFLCALTAEYLGTTNTAGLNAAVFFIWLYIFWWCFFIDATQYVYVAEIWPNALRAQGTALGLASFYLASEITLVAAPVALQDITWR